MEKIAGPINGFYIASYAWRSIDARWYTSYAKICRDKPASYWDADCIFKLFGGENHASAAAALATVNMVARDAVDDLPSFDCSTFGLGMPYVNPASYSAA